MFNAITKINISTTNEPAKKSIMQYTRFIIHPQFLFLGFRRCFGQQTLWGLAFSEKKRVAYTLAISYRNPQTLSQFLRQTSPGPNY